MILFFLLLLFLILGIRSWIEPTVEERLSYQSRVLVTAAINQTVAEELERLGVTYHQMIHLTRDGTGRITALQADTVLLNQIKSAITEQVGERLQELSSHRLSIPLGSLTGLKILSGRGPSVSFRLLPESVVMTNLYHEFTQAGVNQTLHRVLSADRYGNFCRNPRFFNADPSINQYGVGTNGDRWGSAGIFW